MSSLIRLGYCLESQEKVPDYVLLCMHKLLYVWEVLKTKELPFIKSADPSIQRVDDPDLKRNLA